MTLPPKAWFEGRSVKTGFCGTGSHEGTQPMSPSGVPMRTCEFFDTCTCTCHYDLDVIFETAERVREPVIHRAAREWARSQRDRFIMPVISTRVAPTERSSAVGATTTPDLEDYPPDAPEAVSTPLAERRTPTGRAVRGGLEAQVWEACTDLLPVGTAITPSIVSGMIAARYKIAPPSSGAISAVWNRWEGLKFATQLKGPVRFEAFTGEGTWAELELAKTRGRASRASADQRAKQSFHR